VSLEGSVTVRLGSRCLSDVDGKLWLLGPEADSRSSSASDVSGRCISDSARNVIDHDGVKVGIVLESLTSEGDRGVSLNSAPSWGDALNIRSLSGNVEDLGCHGGLGEVLSTDDDVALRCDSGIVECLLSDEGDFTD